MKSEESFEKEREKIDDESGCMAQCRCTSRDGGRDLSEDRAFPGRRLGLF